MALLEKLGIRRREAVVAVRSMAEREAAGKTTDGDAKKLGPLLAEANLSEAQYGELLALHRRREELRAEAAKLQVTTRSMWKAREAVRNHQRETKAIIEARQIEVQELYRNQLAADSRQHAANKAWCELQALEVENAETFGLVWELDGFRLRWGNEGQNNLNDSICDPDAELLTVPREIFEYEEARRRRIMNAAITRARAEHRQALARRLPGAASCRRPIAGRTSRTA